MSLPIQIVDENDRPVRSGTTQEAWQGGLYHRIVRVMVEDEEGNILLQKRSETMPTYPRCWDNSAAGHVDAGETYEVAAKRELQEELGISADNLEEMQYYPTRSSFGEKKLNRFNKIYSLKIPHDTVLKLQDAEVADVKWVTKDELRHVVISQPESVSDGLTEAYERLYV